MSYVTRWVMLNSIKNTNLKNNHAARTEAVVRNLVAATQAFTYTLPMAGSFEKKVGLAAPKHVANEAQTFLLVATWHG